MTVYPKFLMNKTNFMSQQFANSINNYLKREDLIQNISKYAKADNRKATWQILNTFIPYLGLWAAMIFSVLYGFSYWITLLLSIFASGFLVRIFILFPLRCNHYERNNQKQGNESCLSRCRRYPVNLLYRFSKGSLY